MEELKAKAARMMLEDAVESEFEESTDVIEEAEYLAEDDLAEDVMSAAESIFEDDDFDDDSEMNASIGQQAILLSTKTCPNCKIAGSMLQKAGIDYRVLYAEDKEGAELAENLGLVSAPTLIVDNRGDIEVYESIEGVKRFLAVPVK
ncbi:MAG: hypothetical protein IJR58_08845 [Lachnospiraceae bacterium]|nr:hypothetical protein [Lachnospiraceae bacterium]